MPPGSWLGAWAAKARTRDTWTMPKGFTLVNLDEDPSFYFSPSPPPPRSLLRFQGLDWTDFGGETKVRHGQGLQSGEPQARD